MNWKLRNPDGSIFDLTSDQLIALAKSGRLAPTDMVWREGFKDFVPAGRVKGLFPDALPLPANSAAPQVPTDAPAEVTPYASLSLVKPIDFLVQKSRNLLSPEKVNAVELFLARSGNVLHLGLTGLVVIVGLTTAFSQDSFKMALVTLLVALPVLLGLHYAAVMLSESLVALCRTNVARLDSPKVMRLSFLLFSALALACFGGGVWAWGQMAWQTNILLAPFLLCGIVFSVFAFLLACDQTLGVKIETGLSPGEVAIGILTLFFNLAARSVFFVFGGGMGAILIVFVWTSIKIATSQLQEGKFALWCTTSASLAVGAGVLLFYPIIVYTLYLFHYLVLDVARAILSLPAALKRPEEGLSMDA